MIRCNPFLIFLGFQFLRSQILKYKAQFMQILRRKKTVYIKMLENQE